MFADNKRTPTQIAAFWVGIALLGYLFPRIILRLPPTVYPLILAVAAVLFVAGLLRLRTQHRRSSDPQAHNRR
jgi:hypothetical protein